MNFSKRYKIVVSVLSVLLAVSIGFSVGLFLQTNTDSRNQGIFADSTDINEKVSTDFFSFRNVAAEVLPSVVEIDTVMVMKAPVGGSPFDFFDFFSRGKEGGDGQNQKQPQKQEFRRPGLGSGVIVKEEKGTYYILTNNHVVAQADEIKVVMNDGKEYDAELVGRDDRIDLALLSLEAKGVKLPIAVLGDSDALEVGDWVLALGSPFGYMSTVTAGIVSAKGRSGPDQNISDFIQTDAAINSGNSGGPLVDINGEVIGINTWIATKTGDSAGLGFSIPINNAKKVIEDFINSGEVEYGWLGVSISDLSDEMKESLEIDDKKDLNGSLIHNIYIGSPADKNGLQAGDYIITIDGKEFDGTNALVRLVANLSPNQKVEFGLYRNGKLIRQTVKIEKRASQKDIVSNSENLWPGFSVSEINEDIRSYLKLNEDKKGILVIGIDEGSKVAGGLKVGDLILSINDNKISNLADFYDAMESGSDRYLIEYERADNSYYFGVKR